MIYFVHFHPLVHPTGQTNIPAPRLKETRKHGTIVEHKLVFDDDSLPLWIPAG